MYKQYCESVSKKQAFLTEKPGFALVTLTQIEPTHPLFDRNAISELPIKKDLQKTVKQKC